MLEKPQNSWAEYRLSILQQLTWLTNNVDKTDTKISDISKDLLEKFLTFDSKISERINKIENRLTIQEVKSGIYGGIAGFVISLLINWFISR